MFIYMQYDPERLLGDPENKMVFLDIEIDGKDAGRIEVIYIHTCVCVCVYMYMTSNI